MIPQKLHLYLYIIPIFFAFIACQKKNDFTNTTQNNKGKIEKTIADADLFYKNKQLDSAFYFYNKARANCNPKVNTKDYVYCMYYMAEIQQSQADFVGSTTTALETVPYLNKIKGSEYVWNIYSVLGRNYYYTYDYPTAIHYYAKAFTLKVDKISILEAKNNIAVINIKQQRFKDALQIFLFISRDKLVQQNPLQYSKILDYIGYCYYKLNDPKALSFFQTSLKIKSEVKDEDGLGKTNYNLAEYYKKEKPSLSMMYARLSCENFTQSGNIDNRLIALQFIIKNSSGTELKRNSLLYIKLVDSIFEVRQKAKNQFARIKYDSKKEKEENLLLKAQKIKNDLQIEKQKTRNIISYIAILLALGSIIILYFYLNYRAKREKIKATYLSETRISKKLHDELANDVYQTLAFAENRDLLIAENKQQLLHSLDNIYLRTSDISRENNPFISDKNYVISLKEMISGFNNPKLNLLLNGLDTIVWLDVEKTKRIIIYRTIQELLVNMKKHTDSTLVVITFKKVNNDLLINYNDNGQGIDATKIVLKSGLHNVENRILAIKGSMNIESSTGKGFKVFIKFPF